MSEITPTIVARARGMRDLLPSQMRAFRRVEDAFRAAAQRWGYEEIRTPTVESYSLFTAAGALPPQMLSRVYTFLDWDGWSGERVVLRPDSTIPVARAVATAGLTLPARLFYVQSVFRFSKDETEGEAWQCGIEYLGAPAAIGDLEVAAVACETLDTLGIAAEVRISHVGLARAALDAAGITDLQERQDLFDRYTQEGLAALRPALVDKPGALAFVDAALQAAGSPMLLQNLAAIAKSGLPAALPALTELRDVATALADTGRDVVIDLALPRDFEYYTGVVFEFVTGEHEWGGGGRYAPNGPGSAETACGLGLHATLLAGHVEATTRKDLTVAVIPGSEADFSRALGAARALHRNGISAALASRPDERGIGVTVRETGLTAHTPDGERAMDSLDDVVGLLLQYK